MQRTGPAVVCLALLLLAGVRAQVEPALVEGVIVDTSGAVLPGVTVTATPRGGTAQRTTITDEHGRFQFPGLVPGEYEITAALRGFVTQARFVQVTSGQTQRLTIEMRIGAVEETIIVTGTAPAISVAAVQAMPAVAWNGGLRHRGPINTESYDRIDDNSWKSVSEAPLSTFSIDVDTASYANVRRFLSRGELPPRDAARIEELLNYFTYEYDLPSTRDPFAVTTALDDCPWNPEHRLALIGLQARRMDASSTPPRNLVFLVDVSGSMAAPNKLPLVKSSLALLARNLTARDRIAIVVYAGAAGLVLPAAAGNDTTTVLAALEELQAGGSTNGGQGLQLAYRVAREQFIDGGVNRVVLATDGDFNVGVTNQGDLSRLIEEHRATGIALSVLGFGMGNLKDSTMEMLAARGNGNYAYIDSLGEARKVLVEEAAGTLVTVAKDVKLQVEFNPRVVAAYRLIGYENRLLEDQDFNDDRKDAGEMGAGHSVTALYEIVPAGGPTTDRVDSLIYQSAPRLLRTANRRETMTVKLRYKRPDSEQSRLLSVPVSEAKRPHPALGFASAVAEFGLLLHDSPHKGNASFAAVRDRALRHLGPDPFGHRNEFVELVRAAEELIQEEAAP